jgi:6-phosphogluconolactonase
MGLYDLFIGTYSKGIDGGLFHCSFDDTNGEIRKIGNIDIENPSYLQLNGNLLYGVSELSSFNGENGGALFSVDIKEPKKKRLIDIIGTHGKHPCHLIIKDNYVFVSNYSEGSLSIFKTNADGELQPSFQSLHHFGKSERTDRQESSHIHFATFTPDNEFLAICDLGMDKVFLYPYSCENALSTNAKIINCPSGSGPRHLTFSACGKYLYVLMELNNTICCYEYDKGNVKFLQQISTLPDDYSGRSSAAAIHLSPCGNFLASSNRGHDSIALCNIEDNGKLALITHIKTGKEPRDFRFSPCGNWLLSANQNDNSVTIYRKESNLFKYLGIFNMPKPVCIQFGEKNE